MGTDYNDTINLTAMPIVAAVYGSLDIYPSLDITTVTATMAGSMGFGFYDIIIATMNATMAGAIHLDANPIIIYHANATMGGAIRSHVDESMNYSSMATMAGNIKVNVNESFTESVSTATTQTVVRGRYGSITLNATAGNSTPSLFIGVLRTLHFPVNAAVVLTPHLNVIATNSLSATATILPIAGRYYEDSMIFDTTGDVGVSDEVPFVLDTASIKVGSRFGGGWELNTMAQTPDMIHSDLRRRNHHHSWTVVSIFTVIGDKVYELEGDNGKHIQINDEGLNRLISTLNTHLEYQINQNQS